MLRTDLRNLRATRAELDLRAREARRRLENVEREFVADMRRVHPWTRLLRYWFGWQICRREGRGGESVHSTVTRRSIRVQSPEARELAAFA
jgi:hypothetical protein